MLETDALLEGLNEAQREAVLATEGPLLILAGAGSGKTRVITHRVAYLIGSGKAAASEIVAVTFTNKAAGEMKDRIARLAGFDAAGARLGTFHALGLRILRRDAARIGIANTFQIYDTADQLGVLRAAMKELAIDEAALTPRSVLSRISHAKNALKTPEQLTAESVMPDAKAIAACYGEYHRRLRTADALDFDDLIVETIRLFEEHPETAARYARSCKYLLVDEFQDTNQTQYRLIRALASGHGNVCCVGDSDQSIYRFRGADIRNILDFETDYPEARVVKLERNYRSTRTILGAAGGVIQNNARRHPTRLWTENDEGQPVHYHRARDDRDEAEAIVRIVASLSQHYGTGEIAVLYRTNNQSRLIEESLVRAGIPYRIVGALRFYERKEIKDLLAYLRLVVAPSDDLAFARAITTPSRGIGKGTLEQIANIAAAERISLYRASERGLEAGQFQARAAEPLRQFLDLLRALRAQAGSPAAPDSGAGIDADGEVEASGGVSGEPDSDSGAATPIVPLIGLLLERIGFRAHLERAHAGDHEERAANVDALVSAAAEYDEQVPGGGLQGFLDRSSLRGDTDDVQGEVGVTLLTIHSAKGLEFTAVVLSGLEENLFPHVRASESADELEEERRLCYVAITRAKQRLVITNAFQRRSFGDFVENPPSRFLDEIPAELIVYSESSPWTGVQADPLSVGVPGIPPPRALTKAHPWRDEGYATAISRRPARGFGAVARRPEGSGSPRVPAPAPAPDGGAQDDYAAGRTVSHPMFGRGRILHVEGSGDSLKLTIRFEEAGTRKILPRHTTLVIHD